MNNVHGIIYAYHAFPDLGQLGQHRTGASLPFCGRYRLIDFALSSMMDAGMHDVGVIMQRGYLSLMDHLGSGRTWDMARIAGGLHMLPPYVLPESRKGVYEGCMEALNSVCSYICDDIRQDFVLLTRGDLCANVDIKKVIDAHMSSGADVTAVCSDTAPSALHHRFTVGDDGFADQMLCRQYEDGRGVASLEMYVMSRESLLQMVQWSAEGNRLHFHRDALTHMMQLGWKVGIYMHPGYARHIVSAAGYYEANMDMLDAGKRAQLFPDDRRVATRERSDVSTYYSDRARVRNSLVADGCRIEGTVENCILFCGVKVGEGSVLRDCIVMHDTEIGREAELKCVIADKNVSVSPYVTLMGNSRLPLVIPKGGKI